MPNDTQNLSPFSQDTTTLDSPLTSGSNGLPPQPQQTSPLNTPLADDSAVSLGQTAASQPMQAQNTTPLNQSILNPQTGGDGATPPSGGDDSKVTSSHVPKKYGGKKVIATIFSVLFIVGAVAAGVFLVQQQQDLRKRAASGSACQQSPDCVLVDNASNSGSKTVDRTIIYVDITDQDSHRYNPGNTDDGCRKVNISGNTVTWEKYGSGSDCKDVSNVQIWMGNVLNSPTPANTSTPTPGATSTITPTHIPGTTNSPTPKNTATPGPTLPPGVTAQCNSVKAYDLQGNLLNQSQLSQLKAGSKVRFAVSGTTSSGTFDKARFTVNNVLIGESTNKNTSDEYYLDYEIPQSATTFNVKGEVHHSSLGWI